MAQLYEFEFAESDMLSHPYSKVLAEDVYAGEFSVRLRGKRAAVEFSKGGSQVVPIFSYRSGIDTAFRRNYRHIREGDPETCAIWIVKKGSIKVTTSTGTRTVNQNSILLTHSSSPFMAEALVGESESNEHLLAIVPFHMLHVCSSAMPHINGISFSADVADGAVVARTLDMLYAHPELDLASSCEMLQVVLRALARMLTVRLEHTTYQQSVAGARLQDIFASIALEVSNPDVTAADIARRCGISERYLCKLLSTTGRTFREILKEERMGLARELLHSPAKRNHTLGQIAKLAGFRSGAQFSRVFKDYFGSTARAVRKAQPSILPANHVEVAPILTRSASINGNETDRAQDCII